jgi:molecular chaperone IbpA
MASFDLSPLLRSSVGFDRVSRLMDSAFRADDAAPSYPPYNIEKLGEDNYRIVMAVAGFTENDIEITSSENGVVVKGKSVDIEAAEKQYLHRGIAARAFERHFQLADYIRVNGARLENGLLSIELVREVPERLKPRTITIQRAEAANALSSAPDSAKAAA